MEPAYNLVRPIQQVRLIQRQPLTILQAQAMRLSQQIAHPAQRLNPTELAYSPVRLILQVQLIQQVRPIQNQHRAILQVQLTQLNL